MYKSVIIKSAAGAALKRMDISIPVTIPIKVKGEDIQITISLLSLATLLLIAAYFFWPAEIIASVLGLLGYAVNGSLLILALRVLAGEVASNVMLFTSRRCA